jgi:hypothetical protein
MSRAFVNSSTVRGAKGWEWKCMIAFSSLANSDLAKKEEKRSRGYGLAEKKNLTL